MPSPEQMNESSERPHGRFPLAGRPLYAILGIVVILAVVTLVVRNSANPTNPQNDTLVNENAAIGTNSNEGQAFERFPASERADKDADGLSDQEERTAGTNPDLADSDGDELSDYEEVKIYKTNPNRQDSDGDTFPDGQEVKTGNNPSGTGPLRDISAAIRALTNTSNTNTN